MPAPLSLPAPGALAAFAAFVRAGFRRYATYRQATVAAAFTNSIFGFLKCYVLLAVLGDRATVAGYDAVQLATFVWLGQGLLGVVELFTWTELAERVRDGTVASDLLRPVDPVWAYLGTDLGRAGHAAMTRLAVPLLVGAAFFPLYVPTRPGTWPLAAVSITLAVVVSFGTRYLVNLVAFWWLDIRGMNTVWLIGSTMLSGLSVPVAFFPDVLRPVLWATPFPWMFQAPIDVVLERGGADHQLLLVAGQVVAAAALLATCRLVQRRAVRRLVIQGG